MITFTNLNNLTFPPINWTSVKDMLASRTNPHRFTGEAFKLGNAQQLFGQVYSGPKNIRDNQKTVDNTVYDHAKHQRGVSAATISQLLSKIGDAKGVDLDASKVMNIPDILKYHEYQRNDDGSYNVDWYDLKGKSIPRLRWDSNYWKRIGIGYNGNNKAYDNAEKWWLYHQNKLVAYQTNPAHHRKGIQDQTDYLTHYQHLMDANSDSRVDSWLSKIHEAQFWAKYHEHKIDDWVYDRPKYQRRINQQIKLRDKWLAKVKRYTGFKNNAVNRMNMYANAIKQRLHAAWQAKIDAKISAQVQANEANHLTSIYRADHGDPTVIAVSELSPTEEFAMNQPSHSVDKNIPESDVATVSEKQLSGTYYAFLDPNVAEDNGYSEASSPSYANRVHQFKVLQDWASNHRVVVRGFAFWSSTSIQSVTRQMDMNGAANTLELSITFQYLRVAKIATAKQKAPTTKRHGKARQRNPNRSKTYKVKPGDSIWKISGGNPARANAIKRANPKLRNPNLIYPKQKLVIPK